jgi:RNA polymerase sigma-70 factor (ECF subfamily)
MIDDVDRAIVTGLRARDMAAFDRLYARYRERIWAFLVRLTRDRAEAEDLFQETWISAAKHAPRLEESSDVRAWLYAIARNKHRSARRFILFDTRRKESFAHEAPPRVDAPDDELERRRMLRAVERAMEGMSEAHREVLLLSVIEGLETSAIAEVLTLKEEAVRKRLSRARQELSEALALAEKRLRPEAGKASTP